MKKGLSSKLNINVVFRAEPEGGFTVLVPALPGCITYGKNIKEAQKMAEEAISLYLEDMAANGEKLPRNEQTYLSNIEITLPSASSHA
jgi:antitoxin HicB